MGQYSKTAQLLPFYAFIGNSLAKEFIILTLMLCPLERRKEIGTPVTRAIST
jgi:hypothetical protein